MDIGIRRAEPELLRKIRVAYKAAMDKGLWKGHYASTSVLSPKLLRCRRTDARKHRVQHARFGHWGGSRRINSFGRLTAPIYSQ
jgi:hypothetical protein